ncbi:MAG: acylphosphatase [Acidimicrobiia bacterium]
MGSLNAGPVRAHVFVSGRVQAVNFRWSTRQCARQRGVAGWVRNLPDGRVEAVFEGGDEDVRSILAWCSHGPPHADVSDVEVLWEQPENLSSFDVEP